jgi:hypothetical protein
VTSQPARRVEIRSDLRVRNGGLLFTRIIDSAVPNAAERHGAVASEGRHRFRSREALTNLQAPSAQCQRGKLASDYNGYTDVSLGGEIRSKEQRAGIDARARFGVN